VSGPARARPKLRYALLVDELDELRVVERIHQRPPLDVEYLDNEILAVEVP
jgi:hypothetical protein